ncbi:CAZyme family GH47 [Penicillium waksmanii]|uniref:CAZyme family GH47 n=1 Tax=Penicillium waksmanii TaxID=69791 RepID=UPI0025489895|nr:CAZyme family GH47 [Penicillium waksmanii]KAJ5976159.1 CAZyme family GH47 [Penicillium waksmanii]
MLRARRYRAHLVFAAIFLLALLHFTRSRHWSDSVILESPEDKPPAPAYPNAKLDESTPPSKPPANNDAYKYTPFVPHDSSPGSTSSTEELQKPKEPAAPNTHVNGESSIKNTEPFDPPHTILRDRKMPRFLPPKLESLSDEAAEDDARYKSTLPAITAEDTTPHWKKFPEKYPVSSANLIKLPKGPAQPIPKLQAKFKDESTVDKQERLQQLSAVKAEFVHAWQGYKKYAMGEDELMPLTAQAKNPFMGWGATLVDSLDSLWIMDLKDEFSAAVDEIKKIDFTTSSYRNDIPVFETVIRYLGGLLGAYDISGQRYSDLLEKAEELAEILIDIFDTPNRMPELYYNWGANEKNRGHAASMTSGLAEIGSLSMEFTRLAQLTKKDKYYDAIARITNELESLQDSTSIPGLWPMRVNARGCATTAGTNVGLGIPTKGSPSHSTRSMNTTSGLEYPGSMELKREADLDLEAAEPATYNHGSSSSSSDTSYGGSSSAWGSSSADPSTFEPQEQDKCELGLQMPPFARDNKYTMGGMADSTYEYLPKEFLLLGGKNDQYKKMYTKAMDAIRKHLIFRPMTKGARDIRFAAATGPLALLNKEGPLPKDLVYEGAHLTCFIGGMVAVGAKIFDLHSDMELAYKLTDGCVWAYESTTTGLMPETFKMKPCGGETPCDWDEAHYASPSLADHADYRDSEAAAQFRSGESTYGERVKLNSQSRPSKPAAAAAAAAAPAAAEDIAVPLPMPGSLNPHDDGLSWKRDLSNLGAAATAAAHPVAKPTPTHRASDADSLLNRDTTGVPGTAKSNAPSRTSIYDRFPPGMVSIGSPGYYLRPEAIESVFIMYRLTGDKYWRQKGWKMFQSVVKHTHTEHGNAAINDITSEKPLHKNSMESFWLAETLKYFYLLFADPTVLDLDKYVLNTEAHPFLRPIS